MLHVISCMPSQAAFISSYMHSVIIFAVIAALIFTVFAPSNPNADQLGSIHQVYQNLLVRAEVLPLAPYFNLRQLDADAFLLTDDESSTWANHSCTMCSAMASRLSGQWR